MHEREAEQLEALRRRLSRYLAIAASVPRISASPYTCAVCHGEREAPFEISGIPDTWEPGSEHVIEVGGYYHHDLVRTPGGWRSRKMVDDIVWMRGF